MYLYLRIRINVIKLYKKKSKGIINKEFRMIDVLNGDR